MAKKETSSSRRPKPKPAPKPAVIVPAPRLFLVRCTFVGDLKNQRVEGSFRFVVEAPDAAAVAAKLAPAVRKLRRTGELPSRGDVYVEFVLELGGLRNGVVADFERWERNPRRFQHGCIAFSDTCALHESGQAEPAFRFGSPATPVPQATPHSGPTAPQAG